MKKNKLALFDLDDTLFDGDTEGEWVEYMDKNSISIDSLLSNMILQTMKILQTRYFTGSQTSNNEQRKLSNKYYITVTLVRCL